MSTFVEGSALLLTVILALGLGIVAGYGAVSAILHLFGSQQQSTATPATLAHSAPTHAGD